jgi:DNA polymerase-3 subunit epsilon
MPETIELPPKYYLAHFHELKAALAATSAHLFDEEHHRFFESFDSLFEGAQCLFVRMQNRKGRYFLPEKLRYPEIAAPAAVVAELRARGLAGAVGPEDWGPLPDFLPRAALLLLYRDRDLAVKKS